jgi:hypothetical protein
VENDIKLLSEVLCRYLGNIKIEIQYVNTIPNTVQGKQKYVISKFGNELLYKEGK